MSSEPNTAELSVLRELAAAGAAGLRTASQWQSWLWHAERFAYLGFTNTMLVWAQRPDAVLLHDYAGWKRLGCQVTGGEHGIRIISASGTGKVVSLFDLTQTEGPATVVKSHKGASSGIRPGSQDALTALALRAGYRVAGIRPVETPTIDWEAKTIRATSGDLPALAAQVAHVLVHDDEHQCGTVTATAESASVTFLICRRLGLDTSWITFPHVTSWAGSDPRANPAAVVARVGDRVLRAALKAFVCIDATTHPTARSVTGPRRAVVAVAARDSGTRAGTGTTARQRSDELLRVLSEAAR
jgi:DNA primase